MKLLTTITFMAAALGIPTLAGKWKYIEGDDPSKFRMEETYPYWAYCGSVATGTASGTYNEASHLQRSTEFDKVEGHSCLRLECRATSGVYVCNEDDEPRVVSRAIAGHAALMLVKTCSALMFHKPISGTVYVDHELSFLIGYANCHHPAERGPFYKKWGPNGKPRMRGRTDPTWGPS